MSKQPTLITGMPRSGTTFMLRLLDQVPGFKMRPHLDDSVADIKGAYWSNESNLFKDAASLSSADLEARLEEMEQGQGVPEDESMLIKHHDLVCKTASSGHLFNAVIFCVRNNGWLVSAKRHANTAYRADSGNVPAFMRPVGKGNTEQRIFQYGYEFSRVTLNQYKILLKTYPERALLFRYDYGRYDSYKILRRLGVDEGEAVRLSGQFRKHMKKS